MYDSPVSGADPITDFIPHPGIELPIELPEPDPDQPWWDSFFFGQVDENGNQIFIGAAPDFGPGSSLRGLRAGRKVCEVTKFGWRGGKKWREAVDAVRQGGTLEKVLGKVPSKDEAIKLIQDAGGKVTRIEGPHKPPNPHTYPHINYTPPGGSKGKGTIRIAL